MRVLRRVQAGASPGAGGEGNGETVLFLSRANRAGPRERWIRKRDLRAALRLLWCVLAIALLPARLWEAISAWPFRHHRNRQLRRALPEFRRVVAQTLGPVAAEDAEALLRATQAARHRSYLAIAAGLLPRRWRPDIRLEGADGLRQALLRGRGAIIWCQPFTSQSLLGKRALREAGFVAHQISISGHGFSDSRFARRVLNPILWRQENAYLAGRIVFEHATATEVVRRAAAILRGNGIVLITANTHAGSVFLEMPLGPGNHLHMASTPINLAIRGGAALFCMRTAETLPLWRYQGTILPEIAVERGAGMDRHLAMADAALRARDQLLVGIAAHPDQSQILLG